MTNGDTSTQTLGDIGEHALIQRLVAGLPSSDHVKVGPGDDCAVVGCRTGEDLVLTSDPVIEGVHFDGRVDHEAVGHKAVGRVLSDIAAMGATPQFALLNIVAPKTTPLRQVDALMRGASGLAGEHGLAIIGGDVAEGPRLELHVFGIGSVPVGEAVLRSGAAPGDRLYVTGELGGSRLGKHLVFEPRIEAGLQVRPFASAMIDVSDGLASDLRHLCHRSGTGAEINIAALPIADNVKDLPGHSLDHALHDGEDFELLFAVPPDREPALRDAWAPTHTLGLTCIGAFRAGSTIELVAADGSRSELEGEGYRHFG